MIFTINARRDESLRPDAMNRRLYKGLIIVETAIYRVFVFVMNVSHILAGIATVKMVRTSTDDKT
ncbi:hypothetical protein [Nostoc sp. ChiSLP03a]|uniref:hypothetical protein n=1 Tax=Nostoc sp. ChiSLP03a TaxID=3075380 RepID=UPI002AD33B39|nr:hypothetical protein [Nostoc sp. ChiSLP03a]MDZ8213212.1 hypothetical protein [Nostoc sp. ChiSLP03a]